MSGLTGNFAGLGKLESNLRKLASVPSQAAASASAKIKELIDAEFAGQMDPYGRPWAPHKPATVKRWGQHAILDLSGKMKAGVTVAPMQGAGVAVTFDQDYAEHHMTGTANMVPRQVLPTNTLPASWNAALSEAVEESATKILEDGL